MARKFIIIRSTPYSVEENPNETHDIRLGNVGYHSDLYPKDFPKNKNISRFVSGGKWLNDKENKKFYFFDTSQGYRQFMLDELKNCVGSQLKKLHNQGYKFYYSEYMCFGGYDFSKEELEQHSTEFIFNFQNQNQC